MASRLASSGVLPKDLPSWLSYIESLHPNAIEMGLDRVRVLIKRLKLFPDFKIITVAGTNGKGSTCSMLSQIYQLAGYKVGCYTSPHLLRYNERVRINNIEASDDALCQAFSVVERARLGAVDGEDAISLTYFEVGTLAVVWHFMQQKVDLAILEVGLGGRLDAVNAFEPSCAIVTSVDLDHQEFLGETREQIGLEKAGVYRSDIPAICGDVNPPQTLVDHAKNIRAELKCVGHEFGYQLTPAGWDYLSNGACVYHLPLPMLQGQFQLNNAACAVAAVEAMQISLKVSAQDVVEAMRKVSLVGRFYTICKKPWVILDVAHNPHAAIALAENLNRLKPAQQAFRTSTTGKTIAIFAMLADKDIRGVVSALKNSIDIWYVAGIDHARGASAEMVAAMISEVIPGAVVHVFDHIAQACQQVLTETEHCIDSNENDKIIAFGSFFTVSAVMQYLNAHQENCLQGSEYAT